MDHCSAEIQMLCNLFLKQVPKATENLKIGSLLKSPQNQVSEHGIITFGFCKMYRFSLGEAVRKRSHGEFRDFCTVIQKNE